MNDISLYPIIDKIGELDSLLAQHGWERDCDIEMTKHYNGYLIKVTIDVKGND